VVSNSLTTEELSAEATDVMNQMIASLVVLPDLPELAKNPVELGTILVCCRAIDFILTQYGFLPRNLGSELYHILTSSDFDQCVGSSSAATRTGHVYLRRSADGAPLISSFVPCVCHETVHLSAAIVVEMERLTDDSIQPTGIRDGLALFGSDEKKYFRGLNEAVTDHIADLVGTLVLGAVDLLEHPGQTAKDLFGQVSAYQPQEVVVTRLCQHLFPDSGGAEGWQLLLGDYWNGSSDFLDFVARRWPLAYQAMRIMDETWVSAEYVLRLLDFQDK